jgi:hypothetical protein
VSSTSRKLLILGAVGAAAVAGRRVTAARSGRPASEAAAAVTIARDRLDVESAWSDAVARPGFLSGATVEEVAITPAPGDRGSELRVRAAYPRATAGGPIAALTGRSAGQRLRSDLRRFKAVLEAGEVVEVDDAVAGRAGLARTVTERAGHLLGTGGRL